MRFVKTSLRNIYIILSVSLCLSFEEKNDVFILVDPKTKVSILYDPAGPAIDSICANLLADDIRQVTSYRPDIITDINAAKGNVILIGNLQSKYVQQIAGKKSIYKDLAGKWECYGLQVFDKPFKAIQKLLLIAGSDKRGTAYGVFHISEQIGVSPWYWWADIIPKKKATVSVKITPYISSTPSVQYRGIFLNDEDWGLQPWAAKTYEPETGDIGPKTYARIFELLLRLKANLVWPAMHPGTKAFYHYPGNKKVAADYAIIIGSSHAEPMLRNNVGEWDKTKMGDFNYITNRDRVQAYWESRVKESKTNEAIYTLGMRGIHDSGMEGVKSKDEAASLIEKIIADQRQMLQQHISPEIDSVPMAFTLYKEVLDIYDTGLKLPADITLVWPDDNYGYIQRLNNENEKKRKGGSGVYYHASYWGRPHDYLWLSSTHPALIREEMMKAFQNGSDRLWVLNVGDIKPLEYNIQLFLDMAYRASPFKKAGYEKTHLSNWLKQIFKEQDVASIASILSEYNQLAFERRPEFMGWSQTEPTTQTSYTSYDHFNFGDEAQQRIDHYNELERKVRALRSEVEPDRADAFYELVYYPVFGASMMNKKFLYRDKAFLYAKQGRASAANYAQWSKNAYDSIVKETYYYNDQLANGKWKYMMSMEPRALPVYKTPVLPDTKINAAKGWNIIPEGLAADSVLPNSRPVDYMLPVFDRWNDQQYFIDIFLSADSVVKWTASASVNWIKLSKTEGVLDHTNNEMRIWISIDWNKYPRNKKSESYVSVVAGGETKRIMVRVEDFYLPLAHKGVVENNGYVSIPATRYHRKKNAAGGWDLLQGIGHTGNSMISSAFNQPGDANNIKDRASFVGYEFYILSESPFIVNLYILPTHPLNDQYSVRCGISVDDGPVQVVDFKTVGRSEEWKQNVLRNYAVRSVDAGILKPGNHTVKIFSIDPGVIVDRLVIQRSGLKLPYGSIQ